MQESDFQHLADNLYYQLENIIDESGADLDYETGGSVMTITCENDDSKIILSRQRTTCEIWVAARSGGFHFKFVDGNWICATGETLEALLQRVIQEQSGAELSIVWS